MDINEFIDNLKDQYDDVSEPITPETKFREIDGWCSIVALSIISMVDEEYNVSISGNDVKTSVTVKDLFDKVAAKKA